MCQLRILHIPEKGLLHYALQMWSGKEGPGSIGCIPPHGRMYDGWQQAMNIDYEYVKELLIAIPCGGYCVWIMHHSLSVSCSGPLTCPLSLTHS
jgi:hypothetical protein